MFSLALELQLQSHQHSPPPESPIHPYLTSSMSAQPLHAIWDAAASHPFTAAVPKETQFSVGFFLLLGAIILSGLFGLSAWTHTQAIKSYAHDLQTITSRIFPCLQYLHPWLSGKDSINAQCHTPSIDISDDSQLRRRLHDLCSRRICIDPTLRLLLVNINDTPRPRSTLCTARAAAPKNPSLYQLSDHSTR